MSASGEPLSLERIAEMAAKGDTQGLVSALNCGAEGNGSVSSFMPTEIREIRVAAANALGKLGSETAVEPLIAQIEDSSPFQSALVREAAAKTLGKIGDKRAIAPLIAHRWEYGLHHAAPEALVKMGGRSLEPLLVKLRSRRGLNDDRGWIAEVLGGIGDIRAVVPLIALVEDASAGFGVRSCAAEALGKIRDKRAVEALIAALEGGGVLAMKAAWALGEIGDKRAVEPLIGVAVLIEGDRRAWKSAREALATKLSKEAVGPLITALDSEDVLVRREVAVLLGRTSDKRAVGPLIAALNDRSPWVQEAAAAALVDIGEKAVEDMITALEDKRNTIREFAAEVLGKIGDKSAEEALIGALEDEDTGVREYAKEALQAILGHDE